MPQKILLCVPSYDGTCATSLIPFFLEAGKSNYEIIPFPISHSATDAARNRAVMEGRRINAHIVFVDADAIPANGSFTALADKISAEICAACCPYVSAHGAICVGESSMTPKETKNFTGWKPVSNFGTHCCGFNLHCFDNIMPPYFHYEYDETGRYLFNGAEDTTCLRKLAKACIPLYCNWSLWAEHLIVQAKGKPKCIDREVLALLLASYGE